jgi:hypothetical protein
MAWAQCRECGQKGNEPPGLRLEEYPHLQAVFVDDTAVPVPQKLVCCKCGYTEMVPRGSVEIKGKGSK